MRQREGEARYAGGLAPDRAATLTEPNFHAATRKLGRVRPRRLPTDRSLLAPAALDLDPSHSASIGETSRWGLRKSRTVPYSAAADTHIADGTVLPGLLVNDRSPGVEESVRSAGSWAGGRWALELRRSLDAQDDYDIAVETGDLIWLAAFDHAQTRHSYHLRPFVLELE